jgi:hypothetical protein
MKLAIDIGETDIIEIDNRKVPNARTAESFCSITSNSAQTDDGNRSLAQLKLTA